MHRSSLLVAAALLAGTLPGQSVEAVYQTLPFGLDSGHLQNPAQDRGVLFRGTVRFADAGWIRLHLDGTSLPAGGRLRLISALDGAVQWFDQMNP